jgi:hypothetical protein
VTERNGAFLNSGTTSIRLLLVRVNDSFTKLSEQKAHQVGLQKAARGAGTQSRGKECGRFPLPGENLMPVCL